MKSTATRIAILLLMIALSASGTLNVLCYYRALGYHRELQFSRLDPTSAKKFAAENSRLQKHESEKVRVVLFGDSRIAYWNPLPSLLNCQLVNRGVGGETTAQTLLRLERDVIQLKPAIVILQTGINDLKTIGVFPKCKDEIISSCWKNLSTMVNQMAEQDVQVVILTIFPPGPVDLFRRSTWSNDIYHGVEKVNATIRSLKGQGITIVDCDLILAFGKSTKPEYAQDTFHLTSAGYKALNNSLTPILKELVQNSSRIEN